MSFQVKSLLRASGLAITIFASSAAAQVAPPPLEPPKEVPAYTPPPKPEPKAAPAPGAPQPKTAMNARKRDRGDISDLPIDVPYPKLAQPGADGRILRLRQLPDIAALKSNPNVGPKSVEQIMPIIYSRRYRFELMVIDNLDLYWKLTGGMIDNLNMSDISAMGQVAEMLKPLVGETTLSQELLNRGILSRVQGGMNEYIVREYKKAITDEIQVLDGEKGLQEVMRFVLDDSIHEARLAYEAMLAEAMSQISSLVDETSASSDAAKSLKKLEKPLAEDPEQQFLDIKAFDEAFRKLPYSEAMAILQAMRQRREFPSLSPMIHTINVLHDRKQVMEKGFDAVITTSNGEKIDTKKRDAQRARDKENQTIDPADD